ncbi:MAG TPA: hypothetical protein EYN37_04095 [Dehalococcoidia bacterium]|nr:hypothetical protein [Dehalococcoidia bacterium]
MMSSRRRRTSKRLRPSETPTPRAAGFRPPLSRQPTS